MIKKSLVAMLSVMTLSACAATSPADSSSTSLNTFDAYLNAKPVTPDQSFSGNDKVITMEKIMSHPDWLGRQPEREFWGVKGEYIYYYRKREGSEVRDLFRQPANGGDAELVPLADYYKVAGRSVVWNKDKTVRAYVFQGDIFIQTKSGDVTQITRTSARESSPQFLNDGRVVWQDGLKLFSWEPATKAISQLAEIKFADAPKGIKDPSTYVAKEQHKLIEFVQITHQNKKDRKEQTDAIKAANASVVAKPFYLDKGYTVIDSSLSPDGTKVLVAVGKDIPYRKDSDIMPNYVSQNGDIIPVKARQRVADAKPYAQKLYLLNLADHSKTELTYETLPGHDEDVLASVKEEVAKRDGKEYKSEKKAREIGLILDWAWDQSAIQWNSKGDKVAVMLEAWDNKDRWLATVDFDKKELVNQHRLHDDAWVNYANNEFGWLNKSDTLWYLSEETGFVHLYTKTPGQSARQITSGEYEVTSPVLASNDNYVYATLNKNHPGNKEVFRIALNNGATEALTGLGGMNDFALSPQQDKLLINHSETTMPPELYSKAVATAGKAKRVTYTVSDEFLSYNWTKPTIVPVESSHVKQPVFSRVYLPANYKEGDKRRAVIFNHGAGYTQAAHQGWSYYFREFMFHSLLNQQGYVVMDMDYRASKGYGRDWRTAIYRHMGKPEIQDLRDGVNWMVKNANVDANRVGTYGGSYGGFMTFMALFTDPELFQSGAAIRPVTDWAYYNHPYTSNILNTPDVDPIAYEQSSPIYFAEGLNKHLLINAPMVDDNVFFQDVVRLVQRMIELEKINFETAIYPVEPHGFRQPSSWLDEYRRIYKLFEDTL